MKFFKLFVNNKTVIYIFTAIIILAGISAYVSLPRESAPSIQIPYVFISTVYVGVSPEEIEKLVSMELEKEIKGISDIKQITSVSRESFSSVTVEFNPDVKIDDAIQKVRDKVSIAKTNMPKDIEEPVITQVNSYMRNTRAAGIEENEIAFLQFCSGDLTAGTILIPGNAR